MEIAEYIYKGLIEPSYKKTTRADANCDGQIRIKIGETTLSITYSKMSESSGNHRKRYVDYPKGRSKPVMVLHRYSAFKGVSCCLRHYLYQGFKRLSDF